MKTRDWENWEGFLLKYMMGGEFVKWAVHLLFVNVYQKEVVRILALWVYNVFHFAMCFFVMCHESWRDVLLAKLHWSQLNGFSPACLSLWLFKSEPWEQEKLHWSHLKGLSPECVRMWVLRLLAWVHEKLHCVQLKGFSPECFRMCALRVIAWALE